jgi:epoxyqueuosine reductase
MVPSSLSRRIKAQGVALGFDLVGISPVQPPAHDDAFAEWLRRGYHGEMAYLTRTADTRRHPERFLPWARSVVSVALNYRTVQERETMPTSRGPRAASHESQELPDARNEADEPRAAKHRILHAGAAAAGPGRGWISRYAWGADYHDVMGEKLERLLAFVRAETAQDVQGRVFVDAGPVLDREVGARAGIGWFGKNTNLLSMRIGSFFVLGELFLELDLDWDRPVRDRCGHCRLCLEACPTNAFVGPYVLDARKCISYLTIELKGAIPRALRPLMGAHVFGCDICQDVCPYNAKGRATGEPAFQPRPGLYAPELIPLLRLTDAEFKARFRGSPILRAKRRGFLRNACVALGNLGGADAAPALAQALAGDPDALVRAHAAWALGRIGGVQAEGALEEASGREADPAVREEIAMALGELCAAGIPARPDAPDRRPG